MSELMEAMELLEREKGISRQVLVDSIEQSLMQACKSHFGKNDNINVFVDPQTAEIHVTAEKEVVETEADIVDPQLQVTLAEALKSNPKAEVGDILTSEIDSKSFGRIATMSAKNIILQKIREEERNVTFSQYADKSHTVVTGTVSRYQNNKSYFVNLGKVEALLSENEQIKGEKIHVGDRLKVYVVEVKDTKRGPKITVSRTHPELVRKLFEEEVTEIRDGIVEIRSVAREAGSRTKMAVSSNRADVDPVGACVGLNGSRVNAVVNELRNEKIDIIQWSEDPAILIENALSPAKVVSVEADPEAKSAKVIVPDYQLSLAIGKEGQNARLAAKLTGFRIDIKSESKAKAAGEFDELLQEEFEDETLPDVGLELVGDDPVSHPAEEMTNGQDLITEQETPAADLSGMPGNEG